MWIFWAGAFIPLLIGAILWYLNSKDITWWEWLAGTGVALATAGIFQFIALHGMTADTETWSGWITAGRHTAAWQEYYEYAVYRTEIYYTTETTVDSKGRTSTQQVMHTREVFDHWEPTTCWHSDEYVLESNINTSYNIYRPEWYNLADKFGGFKSVQGHRTTFNHNSRMIGGDPNDYITVNRKGYIKPCHTIKSFENRVKAAPSLFSFSKVPKDINVFSYPSMGNWWQSNRLLGTASKDISIFAFDQLNAKLGIAKNVNVIMIGFDNQPSSIAQWQQSAWIGGKKNDLVLCYGTGWSMVFGWSESEIVKRNLETILLKPITTDILPTIEATIMNGYEKKNWHKFDYITIEPPAWSYWIYALVTIIAQVSFWWWARENEFGTNF